MVDSSRHLHVSLMPGLLTRAVREQLPDSTFPPPYMLSSSSSCKSPQFVSRSRSKPPSKKETVDLYREAVEYSSGTRMIFLIFTVSMVPKYQSLISLAWPVQIGAPQAIGSKPLRNIISKSCSSGNVWICDLWIFVGVEFSRLSSKTWITSRNTLSTLLRFAPQRDRILPVTDMANIFVDDDRNACWYMIIGVDWYLVGGWL